MTTPITVEMEGDEFTADWDVDASVWYVSDAEGRVLFAVRTLPRSDKESVELFVHCYLAGRTNGFAEGKRYGETQTIAQVHKLLGIDQIVAAISDLREPL